MSCSKCKPTFLKVYGTVQEVDPASGRVELLVSGIRLRLTLPPDCPELPSGRPHDLRQLRPADGLEVSYSVSQEALTIHAVRVMHVAWAVGGPSARVPTAAVA
jgi:hypothetical protein